MMPTTERTIDIELLKIMNDRSKAIKSSFVLFSNTPNGIECIGIWGNMTAIKTGHFEKDALFNMHIDANFAIKQTELNGIVKECEDGGIQEVSLICYLTDYGIVPYAISNTLSIVYLEKFALIFNKVKNIYDEWFGFNHLMEQEIDLSADPYFNEIMSLKSGDGTRFFNIGKYPVTISPLMLGLNKGDTAIATISPTANGAEKFLAFTVKKPKKKHEIHILMKIRPL